MNVDLCILNNPDHYGSRLQGCYVSMLLLCCVDGGLEVAVCVCVMVQTVYKSCIGLGKWTFPGGGGSHKKSWNVV